MSIANLSLTRNNADLYESKEAQCSLQLIPSLSHDAAKHSASFLSHRERVQLAMVNRVGYRLIQELHSQEILLHSTDPLMTIDAIQSFPAWTVEVFKSFSNPRKTEEFAYGNFGYWIEEQKNLDNAKLFLPLCELTTRESGSHFFACLEAIQQGNLADAREHARRILPFLSSYSSPFRPDVKMLQLAARAFLQSGALEEARELFNNAKALLEQKDRAFSNPYRSITRGCEQRSIQDDLAKRVRIQASREEAIAESQGEEKLFWLFC